MTEATGTVDRISGLDVTRGFAVMGILAMNIVAFSMPENAYINPRVWGGDSGIDLWTWAANFLIFDSKMRGLFSIMFGASTLLVIESAANAARRPARTHYARMAVLALFGLIHFYLIWYGDILFLYAMMGMIPYAFRNLGVKALAGWGISLTLLSALLWSAGMSGMMMGATPAAPPELAESYASFAAEFAPGSAKALEDIEIHRSGFVEIATHQLTDNPAFPFIGLVIYGPETLGLMLIGMALFKSGLLRGTWSLERLAKWRNTCLAIGIPGNALLLWWQLSAGLEPALVLGSTFGFSVPFDVTMSVGYAALAMGLAQRFATSSFIRRVGAAGRAAFTNYLGTSILMTFIFYGWGLGQYGHWSRAEVYVPVLVAWAIMLLWSKPWLERFHYGPLEWLWRSLSRGRLQPMRK
jgi:uncharacterized protein